MAVVETTEQQQTTEANKVVKHLSALYFFLSAHFGAGWIC
jgi:hypothetical protein